ncbi:MAG: DUF2065 domain-containing protein [Chromatiales bacterium]|nr:DUF2065 domain-containing protein [Gammaproteobacteria bacterium]MCP5230785.1 DUF2065 domain-containing protein [Zoogloeaceae bacterium]MCP5351917.1 DUF2065 domain-containing protein [Chromatiales bacterium]
MSVAWSDLWAALALMLVLEGLMPFLSPAKLRETLLRVLELDDRTLRTIGVISIIAGLLLLHWAR